MNSTNENNRFSTKNFNAFELSKYLKLHGRTLLDEKFNALNIYWTASGIEFNFEGTQVCAEFSADYWNEENAAYVTVILDGEKINKIMLQKEIKWYELANNLKPQKHNIKILKNTEAQCNIVSLYNLKISGAFLPYPKAAERKIEFLGDSITCGAGNLSAESDDRKYEDGLQTYAAFTANALNADYNVLSASGWGLVCSANGSTEQTIPFIYNEICSTPNNGINRDKEWDFSNFKPDIVVVNLGTNDANPNAGVSEAQYKKGIVDFVKKLRQRNNNARILWAVGMMGNEYGIAIEKAISELKSNGIDNVFYLEFEHLTDDEYKGYNWHPNVKSNEIAGNTLTKKIQEIMDWK